MVAPSVSGTRRRILGALLFLPLIALFVLSQSIAQWLLIPLALVMAWEFALMMALPLPVRLVLLLDFLFFSVPAPLIRHMEVTTDMSLLPVFLALGGLVVIFIWMSSRNHLAALFIAMLVTCILAARELLGLPNGHLVLLSLAAVVAACDIAAYFVGRRIGGAKLAPLISPNKTRSGAVGGVLGAMLVSLLLASWLPFAGGELVVGTAVIAILAQAGDLLESALKRNLGVKDSGTLIPGHGGFLDRFDGYLLTLPVLCLYMV